MLILVVIEIINNVEIVIQFEIQNSIIFINFYVDNCMKRNITGHARLKLSKYQKVSLLFLLSFIFISISLSSISFFRLLLFWYPTDAPSKCSKFINMVTKTHFLLSWIGFCRLQQKRIASVDILNKTSIHLAAQRQHAVINYWHFKPKQLICGHHVIEITFSQYESDISDF